MLAESVGRPMMVVNLWASLGYGLVLLLTPDLFCDILQADAVNTAWLRTIGAALLGTNVLGGWLWLRNPSLDMGRVQTTTAGLEAAAMGASLLLGEFTADNIWMVQASVFLALIVTIGLVPTARGNRTMSHKPGWTESSLSEHYDSPNSIIRLARKTESPSIPLADSYWALGDSKEEDCIKKPPCKGISRLNANRRVRIHIFLVGPC